MYMVTELCFWSRLIFFSLHLSNHVCLFPHFTWNNFTVWRVSFILFFSEGTTVLFGHSNCASSWSGALWEKCFVLDVTLAFVSHLNLWQREQRSCFCLVRMFCKSKSVSLKMDRSHLLPLILSVAEYSPLKVTKKGFKVKVEEQKKI